MHSAARVGKALGATSGALADRDRLADPRRAHEGGEGHTVHPVPRAAPTGAVSPDVIRACLAHHEARRVTGCVPLATGQPHPVPRRRTAGFGRQPHQRPHRSRRIAPSRTNSRRQSANVDTAGTAAITATPTSNAAR